MEAIPSGKFYTNGAMFGETDIIFNRQRLDTYLARMDCYMLRISLDNFLQILDEFEDLRNDIEAIAE